jgi:hypothetical protein
MLCVMQVDFQCCQFGPTDLAAMIFSGPLQRHCPGNVSEATQLAGQKWRCQFQAPKPLGSSWFVVSNMRFTWGILG